MAEPNISVEVSKRTDGWTAMVRVAEGATQTRHRVTVRQATYDALTGGRVSAEELVRASLRFLLEREPKESIMPEFDLMVIGAYFPEYSRAIGGYFEAQG